MTIISYKIKEHNPTAPKEKIHITVTGSVEIAAKAVLIIHSNFANWLIDTKARLKKGAWSAHSSQLHSLALSIVITAEAEGWDLMEGDINGKLCLWHWWGACPCLDHVLSAWVHKTYRTMRSTGRIQKKQYHISIRDASNELQEKNTMCTILLFFFPLHPLISFQGRGTLQTIPACTGWKAGKSLQAFRHTVQTLIHTSRQFRVSSPPDCGRKLAQLKQKPTLDPLFVRQQQ